MSNKDCTLKRLTRRSISRREFLRYAGLAGLTLLSGRAATSLFGGQSNRARADESHQVYLPLIAKVPPIPPLSQEMVQEAYEFYSLGDPVPPTNLRFEFKPNLSNPDQPAIVFARDPETGEIILATRFNLETQEQEWHVAKLRDLADAVGMRIGTNLSSPWFDQATIARHDEIVKDNFNHAIVDHFFMSEIMQEPDIFHPEATRFNFEKARRVIDLAKANGMTVEASPIIYGESDFKESWSLLKKYWELAKQSGFTDAIKNNVSWDEARRMRTDPEYGNQLLENLVDSLPDPEKREELREVRRRLREFIAYYVQRVVGEFQGEVNIWRLANEFDMNPQSLWDPYFWLVGPDYPDLIFQAAREADPNAKLIINPAPGYEPGDPYFFDMTVPVIQRLKQKGIIDGVGDQGHEYASQPFNWKRRLDRDWGVEVLITERDVNLENVPGTQEERFELQAEIYAYSLREALSHNVKFFTLWESYGDDEDNWFERMVGEQNADPTIFDDYQPKSAYFVLKAELEKVVDQQ